MANLYIERGYVEPGYFDGDITIEPGQHKLRFFIKANDTEDEIMQFVEEDESNIAIVFGVFGKPSRVVTKDIDETIAAEAGETAQELRDRLAAIESRVSDVEVAVSSHGSSIRNLEERSQTIETSVTDLQNQVEGIRHLSLKIMSDNGQVFEGAAHKIDDTTYSVTIPQEMVATEYKIIIDYTGGG